jgi:hypothetical protein
MAWTKVADRPPWCKAALQKLGKGESLRITADRQRSQAVRKSAGAVGKELHRFYRVRQTDDGFVITRAF